MSRRRKGNLQSQLSRKKKENLELKRKYNKAVLSDEGKRKDRIWNQFVELLIVATLVSLGASAVVSGLIAIHFPCDGALCEPIAKAGAICTTIGTFLIVVAAVIILWRNAINE